ncbi:hypothetical protein EV356DRAFT_500218 [Viridothelium virens]|uniref:Uncharacterized protein n=1 Tax=Viridothelium virens TaxID=1048519 RepID=A0A6A6HCE1_VIRVR|nr:hypothetical protein EV356DRAFT_500218 [Viridothelium virens]
MVDCIIFFLYPFFYPLLLIFFWHGTVAALLTEAKYAEIWRGDICNWHDGWLTERNSPLPKHQQSTLLPYYFFKVPYFVLLCGYVSLASAVWTWSILHFPLLISSLPVHRGSGRSNLILDTSWSRASAPLGGL